MTQERNYATHSKLDIPFLFSTDAFWRATTYTGSVAPNCHRTNSWFGWILQIGMRSPIFFLWQWWQRIRNLEQILFHVARSNQFLCGAARLCFANLGSNAAQLIPMRLILILVGGSSSTPVRFACTLRPTWYVENSSSVISSGEFDFSTWNTPYAKKLDARFSQLKFSYSNWNYYYPFLNGMEAFPGSRCNGLL